MEGSLNSSHVGILHVDRERKQAQRRERRHHAASGAGVRPDRGAEARGAGNRVRPGLRRHPFRAEHGSDDVLVRVTPFIMPNGFMIPPGNFAVFAVPYDDTNTGWLLIYWDRSKPVDRAALLDRTGLSKPGFYANERFIATWQNNFQQDRETMASGSWSGLPGITVEDAVIQLSQGAVLDRSKENLIPADLAIVRARRLLLESVRQSEPGTRSDRACSEECHANPIGREADIAGGILHALVPGHLPQIARPQQMEPVE